jgi:hypothetical protein
MQRDTSTTTRLAEMSGGALAIPYREPAWLWRTIIAVLARGWKLFHDIAIYVIILGVGVSFAASWLTSQATVDPSTWNVTRYVDSLAQNLLVALSILVLLAAVLFIMWRADDTEQRWAKRKAAVTQAKQRELETEEVKRVVEATVTASIASPDFTPPHPIATLQPAECDVIRTDTTYLERTADDLARNLLRAAAARTQASEGISRYLGSDRTSRSQTSGETTGRGTSGLFVVGKHNIGKSRLVYEALHTLRELQDWTFVQWPSAPAHPFQVTQMKGKRVVILIDRLEDYAESPDKRITTWLSRLPIDFEREKIPLIVIATARDGNNRKITAKLGSLIGALQLVEVGPITREQAEQLTAELRAKNKEAHDCDLSSPGAIINGCAMPEDYEKLSSDDARCILKILRLFDSAGIGTDPVYVTKGRVCAVADSLFDIPRLKWRAACDELIRQDLIESKLLPPSYERVISAKSRDALSSVSDYPLGGEQHNMEMEDWPLLYEVFKQQMDSEAIVALGSAWWNSDLPFRAGEAGWPAKLDYLKRAAACFRTVLALRSAQPPDDPQERALVQWYLAEVLLGHNAYMETTDQSPTRLEALQEAAAMYRLARQFFSGTDDTETQFNLTVSLATTLSEQARFLDGVARAAQLAEASALEEEASQQIDQQTSLEAVADFKSSVAYTCLYRAQIAATREEAARLMAEAVEAIQGALSDREQSDPAPVNLDARARAQGDVGYMLRFQASLASGVERINMLKQCESMLRHAVDILPAAEDATAGTWIWVHALLADVLLQLARLVPAQAETQRYLAEAESLCDDVENSPALRNMAETVAWAQGIRGGVLVQQAQYAGEAERDTHLLAAERYCAAALDAPNRESAPEDWAGARFNTALLALEFARHTDKDDVETACADLETGRTVLGEALEVYTAPLFAAEYQQALALRERIEQHATLLKCGT